MPDKDLLEAVSSVWWFHTMELAPGVVTRGRDNTPLRAAQMKLPDDLSGQTVLDVGAADGFFSFEAERRGAARVLATDAYDWKGFELARLALGSQVEYMHIDVLDLSPERPGVFDVVLFLGVLYHMRNPLLALERVAAVTQRMLIVESLVERVGGREPVAVFHPHDQTWNDRTTWWVPNPAAVKAMLSDAGFSRVEQVSFTPRFRTAASAGVHALSQEMRAKASASAAKRRTRPGIGALRQGRAVFHAFKD